MKWKGKGRVSISMFGIVMEVWYEYNWSIYILRGSYALKFVNMRKPAAWSMVWWVTSEPPQYSSFSNTAAKRTSAREQRQPFKGQKPPLKEQSSTTEPTIQIHKSINWKPIQPTTIAQIWRRPWLNLCKSRNLTCWRAMITSQGWGSDGGGPIVTVTCHLHCSSFVELKRWGQWVDMTGEALLSWWQGWNGESGGDGGEVRGTDGEVNNPRVDTFHMWQYLQSKWSLGWGENSFN